MYVKIDLRSERTILPLKVGVTQLATIGEKIREARLRRGFTQTELGADLVTPSMISQIESDKTRPSYHLLVAIANRLSLPLEYFMSDHDDQYTASAYIQLARCYVLFGNPRAAIDTLQATPMPNPPGLNYYQYQLVLAEALAHDRQFSAAVGILEELRELAMRNQDAALHFSVCRQAGHVEYDTCNFDGAMHEWETALTIAGSIETSGHFPTMQLQSQLAEIYLRLHDIHDGLGNTAKATAMLDAAKRCSQSSSRLRAIADSLINDGLSLLASQESAKAEDMFRHASVVSESARLMEQSIRIAAEHQAQRHQIPPNPWTQVAIAATTVSPANLLKCELHTIQRLLEHRRLEEAERRVADGLKVLEEYKRHEPQLAPDLVSYPYQFEAALAQLSYLRGDLGEAVARLQPILDALYQHRPLNTWVQLVPVMVEWLTEAKQFAAAIQLTQRLNDVLIRNKGVQPLAETNDGGF